MKKFSIILSFCLMSLGLTAQYGINVGVRQNGDINWRNFTGQEDFMKTGFKVGLDYWFRLKKVRVEFTPELNFSQFKQDYTLSIDQAFQFKNNVFGFHFNTNIYPLNFKDDCNCPTFKKDGQILDKGFHIILSPGINYFDLSIENGDNNFSSNDFVFSAGIGAGLDIGLNDYITLTPMVLYHRYFDAEWEDLETAFNFIDDIPENSSMTSFNQLFFGARVRVRFDEMNKYGYR